MSTSHARFMPLVLGATVLAGVHSASAHTDIVAPNGGESFEAGTPIPVQWAVTAPHDTENWDLWYSTESADGPWIEIALNLPLGDNSEGAVHTYMWTPPATIASSAWVRVQQDNTGDDYDDVNDAPFTITAACPWDCAPAGGNGTVNVDDLLAVINAFGSDDPACDVAPLTPEGTFGNGLINVDDVIAIIVAFGDCP